MELIKKKRTRRTFKKCSCGKKFRVIKNAKYTRKFPDLCLPCSVVTKGTRTNGQRSKLYTKWVNMKCSCYTPTYKDYRLVGAKGIVVCDEWQTFEGFQKWAHLRYVEGRILKRIDNTKNFSPDNCNFISKSANRFYEYNGSKMTFHSWKNNFNSKISNDIIRNRLERGWDIKRAFTQPPRVVQKNETLG